MTKTVVLDHGAGGGMSQELIAGTIASILGDTYIGEMEDSALLELPGRRIAVTTDSFVVEPLFFDGGDIGKIAVAGTVNDLAVSGSRPLYLTLAVVLEEGFALADFRRILHSVRDTAVAAGVQIVAGDTKVVRRGEADGIFLNTTGVGVLERPLHLSSKSLRTGDQVIVTGYLGDHSIHLLSQREGLGFEHRVRSDCAVLNHVIADVLDACGEGVRCIRDVTRGAWARSSTSSPRLPRPPCCSPSPTCPSGRRPPWPPTCWASTSCTSPTRETSASSSPRSTPRPRSRPCTPMRSARGRPSSAAWSTEPREPSG